MVKSAVRKFIQKAMKDAGSKVPKLGTISSDIKKAQKKGDKATVTKLKRKKAKIVKQKEAIADKKKAEKDLKDKNKQARGSKKATSLRFSSQTGSGRGKFERGNPPAPKRVAAKDTPFDADLDTPQVAGRAGGAAIAKSARAGVINIGDDAVGFTNFLKMQQSKTGLKKAQYKLKLEQIVKSKTATKAQKKKAQDKIDAMDAKDEADYARSIRKSAQTRTGQTRAGAKSRDPFFRALEMAKRDGELGEDYEKLLPNQKKQVERAAAAFKRLKDEKDLPKDVEKRNKELLRRKLGAMTKGDTSFNQGGLKMPTANQTGLRKLPTSVRNKMGYMYGGGMSKKPKMGNMDYRKGGMVLIALNLMKKKGKSK
tara:strand:- start:264 stop:1367 length:1104 start_codon:yes stop_codon:yes gene_type:complete